MARFVCSPMNKSLGIAPQRGGMSLSVQLDRFPDGVCLRKFTILWYESRGEVSGAVHALQYAHYSRIQSMDYDVYVQQNRHWWFARCDNQFVHPISELPMDLTMWMHIARARYRAHDQQVAARTAPSPVPPEIVFIAARFCWHALPW